MTGQQTVGFSSIPEHVSVQLDNPVGTEGTVLTTVTDETLPQTQDGLQLLEQDKTATTEQYKKKFNPPWKKAPGQGGRQGHPSG